MKREKRQNVRDLALDVILRVMEQGELLHLALRETLDANEYLQKQERAFLTRLVQGTVERCIEMDYLLNCYSKVKVDKMKPVIRGILRSGVYQLLYMEQVPASAVCNEAVKLAVTRKFVGLKGFVNGVLRTISREREKLPYPESEEAMRYLSVRYSQPDWIVNHFVTCYGREKAEEIFSAFLGEEHEVCVRCNTSKAAVDEIVRQLRNHPMDVKVSEMLPEALYLSGFGRLTEVDAFQKGLIQVQDIGAILMGHVSGIRIGDSVIDLCAAPGGKTIHAADLLGGSGMVTACDLTAKKVGLIEENVARVGFDNIRLVQNDARVFRAEWEETADVVLADLPCSGLGVIGRKSDIKYKTKPEDIKVLVQQQREMLAVAYRYLKHGGRLVYGTCTIAAEENEENVRWALENLPLQAVSIEEMLPPKWKGQTGEQGYLQILPEQSQPGGFFVAVFERK